MSSLKGNQLQGKGRRDLKRGLEKMGKREKGGVEGSGKGLGGGMEGKGVGLRGRGEVTLFGRMCQKI